MALLCVGGGCVVGWGMGLLEVQEPVGGKGLCRPPDSMFSELVGAMEDSEGEGHAEFSSVPFVWNVAAAWDRREEEPCLGPLSAPALSA